MLPHVNRKKLRSSAMRPTRPPRHLLTSRPPSAGAAAGGRALPLAAILALLLLTLPRLAVNYGADGDAWRNAAGAERLVCTGSYHPFRLPGSPFFDRLLAAPMLLLPESGAIRHVATNSLVLFFYVATVLLFHQLTAGRANRGLLTALFMFTPMLLKNAVTTMDYVPGLALLLASYAALQSSPFAKTTGTPTPQCCTWTALLTAGLLLGCAAGMRITHLAFVVPTGIYVWLRSRHPSRALLPAIIAVPVGLILNQPLIAAVATGSGMPSPKSIPRLILIMGYNGLALWGPVAAVVLAVLLVRYYRNLQTVLVRSKGHAPDPELTVEWLAVILFVSLFVLLPDEPEYLLPMIPFAYLCLGRCIPRRGLLIFMLFTILAGFVSVDLKGGRSGQRVWQCRPVPGILVSDFLRRREFEQLRRGLPRIPDTGRSVVLAGNDLPLFYDNPYVENVPLRNHPDLAGVFRYRPDDPAIHRVKQRIVKLRDRPVFFVTSLPRPMCEQLQQRGFTLYMFSLQAPSYALHLHGYDPYELGIRTLEILNDGAFYRIDTGDAPSRPDSAWRDLQKQSISFCRGLPW